MSCEHEVRFTIKPTDDACRFHFDVRAYKDRIVAPDEYSGATEVTPSDSEQVLPTKDKLVREDITVNPAPTEYLSTDHNGTFTPSDGKVGFSQVRVDVPATGYDKGTLIYEGDFATATGTFAVTKLPDGQPFSFDKIEVELSNLGHGLNSGWRQYWRSDLPLTGNHEHMFNAGVGWISGATALNVRNVITIEDDTYIRFLSFGFDADNPTRTGTSGARRAHDGYNKITAYGWWAWQCPAGAHIKITGYNRTS
jgi:hypothetical protein